MQKNIREYLSRIKGGTKGPPRVGLNEVLWSWLGSVTAVCTCGYLSLRYFEQNNLMLMTAPLGASAVLVFGTIKSSFAQPRNLIGGHVISGLIGVVCYQLFGESAIMAAGLAVSLATAAMLVTKTVHPPGGATALIAVIGDKRIHDLSFIYPFVPAGLGACILLIFALVFNNLSKTRRYPEYWF